jgi:membrane-bound lytic murein transglycosylase B
MNKVTKLGTLSGIAITATVLSGPAAAQESFAQCRDRISSLAIERGISRATATTVLADVEPLERVISADRNQPEFVQSFAQYLGLRVNAERVATGRALYAENRALLDRLAATYGVPG